MAQNFVQSGEFLTFPAAPYALNSGDGCLLGLVFGVAQSDAAAGAEVVLGCEGCWELPKVTANVFAAGAAVYWDNAAKTCTSTATSNTKIGVAIAAVDGTGSVVRVRLNESF